MPLPQTKVFLSQALSAARANALLPQVEGDLVSVATSGVPTTWIGGAADLNGDGRPELLIGGAGSDAPTLDAGRVYVTPGSAAAGSFTTLGNPATDFIINGAQSGDHAGAAVSAIGDLNADARGDLLIGAPGVDVGAALEAGGAYAVWGQAGAGTLNLSQLATAGSGKGFFIKGETAGDAAGQALVALADQNGDGKGDIAIGAPGYDLLKGGGGGGGGGGGAGGGGTKLDVGAVYVVWGKSGDTPVNLADVSAGIGGYRITGDGTHDQAGATLATLADMNGDGRAEIIVGAPSSGLGGADSGAVYVVFGKSSTTAVDLKALGTQGFRIVGALGDKAGSSVAGIADLNGDGRPEVVVGAENSDRVYVVFGKSTSTDVLLSSVAAGNGGFVIHAEAPGDFHGMTVTAGGDFNRDGRPDLVIGAPANAEGGRDAGAVYVVWGGSAGVVDLNLVAQGIGGAKIVGAPGSLTGSSVATLGDSNGDGTPELMIGTAGFGQESVNVLFAPDSWQPDNNIYGTEGADTIGAGYGSGSNVVGEGHDNVMALGGNDSLSTGGGSDDLDGGTGADTMSGGLGDDRYWVDNAADQVVELAGQGIDTVIASVNYALPAEVEKLQLEGAATAGTGNEAANTLSAGTTSALLSGLGGNDQLVGGGGNDTLDGGSGDDLMAGGAGNDTYRVDQPGDAVQEAAGAGADLIISSLDLTLPANVEALQLTGTAHAGTGNELANILMGGDGNDTLDGGTGADLMVGGAGDDLYLVDNAADSTSEAAGGGTDTVRASVDYTLRAEVEVLQLVGTAHVGVGNASANTIIGTAGSDTLDGAGGADLLVGGTGNDTYKVDHVSDLIQEEGGADIDTVVASVDWTLGSGLEVLQLTGAAHVGTGNAGDNTLLGGDGNDSLDGAAGHDLLAGGLGDDTYLIDAGDVVQEAAGGGNDRIIAAFSTHVVANVETLQVTGEGNVATGDDTDNILLGAAGHQELIGGVGNDSLDGGTGGDLMSGGDGDDTYFVDDLNDVVVEVAGGGIDTVVTAFDGVVAENIENVRLTGTAHTVTGNSGNNRLSGNSGNDSLDGAGGDDLLLGGDGSDQLISHAGNDTLSGGAGDDVYKVGGGSTVHIEDLLGHDSIDASDEVGNAYIDLSGGSVSHVDNDDVYFNPGGTTAGPLDVQFLQDLTGSFGDDIANVRTLVPQIVTALRAVQANSQFGVTSFVDKPISPFGVAGEWVYRLELPLTPDQALLSRTYNSLAIRFGNDGPEAQIESLMQLALHAQETGFRPDSARFVVLFTDAPFHAAGDGAAAGIFTPNNGDAIMDGGGIGEDYPMIPQVRAALEAANIIPVFAIAAGFTPNYDFLANALGRGVVVPLTIDSSNVVTAITSGLTEATTTYIEDAYGGAGNDTLLGNVKANALVGNAGNDTLSGAAGNDSLTGGSGNDSIDGGDGDDTALFSGTVADYDFGTAAGALTVTDHRAGSPDGSDTLLNVEHLRFAGTDYAPAALTPTAPTAVADHASGLIEAGGIANATPGQPTGSGNVLVNDTDPNLAIAALGEQLHVAAVQAGAVADGTALATAVAGATTVTGQMGTLTINPDGSYSYALNDDAPATQALKGGQIGTDEFTYTVADASGLTDNGSLSIHVTGGNDAPVTTVVELPPMLADTGPQLITAAQLLAGASDVDADPLSLAGLTVSSGTLVDNLNGSWSFTPAAGDSSAVTFNFTVSDWGLSTPASATLDLLPNTAQAPVTTDATASGAEDSAVAVVLTGTDADGSVAALRITSLPVAGSLFADAALTQPVALNGQLPAVDGAATVWLKPAADFNGVAPFGFAAVDNLGLVDATPGTATVTVTPVNDAPVAVADTLAATEDSAASFTATQLLANDTDVDGDVLSVTGVSAGVGGSVVLNADGSIGFTPDANFNGAASFSYTAGDGTLTSAPVTVTVNVTPVNDAPTAQADTVAATEDQAVTYTAAQLLGNDADIDGDVLHIASVTAGPGGSVVLNADGTVSFTPAANFNGAASFSYSASDGTASSADATVTVTVAAVNDAPTSSADSLTATEDTAIVFSAAQLLGNDSDVDGDVLRIASVSSATGGSAVLNADGSVSFTPAANFNGEASFSYSAGDGTLTSAATPVTVAVAAVNDAPVAVADAGFLANSGALLSGINVLANDTDVDGDVLHVSGTPTALHGTVSVNADGSLAYTSVAGYLGSDTISYSVSDGTLTADGTVSLTVKIPNDPPVIAGPAVLAASNEDAARVITAAELLAQASDANGDALSVLDLSASSGTLTANADGSWTLLPVANDDSAVSFSYRVSDGLESAAATATLDLLPVNDAALISGTTTGAVTEASGSGPSAAATGTLTATDIDSPTTFSLQTAGSYGSLSINATGAWIYALDNTNASVEALDSGSTLVDTVWVQTADGTAQALSITIAGVNDLRSGTAGDDVLTGGNGTDTLLGQAGRDTLTGGGGNDLLDGGADVDAMTGGAGNDTYVVDNTRDSVTEAAGEGTDTVQSSITYTLGANVENLLLTGSAALNGTGNALANAITGNSGSNLLLGGAGADALDGGAGTDTASYAGSTAGVSVSLTTGLGSGGDAEGDTLANLENLTGSSANDTLEGNAGNNVLDGGAGTDIVSYANAPAGVTVNLAVTIAQSTGGAGIDTLIAFEGVTGSALADLLTGSSAANLLNGGAGNDTLNGAAGADTLVGGSGADQFVFATLGDLGAGGSARDSIADFSHADGDIIHLVGIDADSKTGGNQAFSFIGTAAFGNHAGELRYTVSATGAALLGDINGDGKADFQIDLVGVTTLDVSDFAL